MTQEQRLDFMIRYLLDERNNCQDIALPSSLSEKRRLLRSLMNVRPPVSISADFLKVQDAYLEERLAQRGVVSLKDLAPLQPGLFLWQGDITTLAADAIVNAANIQLLGCFVPCHNCVWSALISWPAKRRPNLPEMLKSRKPIVCPAAMYSTPLAPLSMGLLPKQIENCCPAATAPAWNWLQPTACTA